MFAAIFLNGRHGRMLIGFMLAARFRIQSELPGLHCTIMGNSPSRHAACSTTQLSDECRMAASHLFQVMVTMMMVVAMVLV
jgi:hypothetical protein